MHCKEIRYPTCDFMVFVFVFLLTVVSINTYLFTHVIFDIVYIKVIQP